MVGFAVNSAENTSSQGPNSIKLVVSGYDRTVTGKHRERTEDDIQPKNDFVLCCRGTRTGNQVRS